MDGLDINTMQFMSTAILLVLSILMTILWNENREQPGAGYWCAFSVLLTIDTIISCFPEIRNMESAVYFFNIVASYFYFFLMLGCFKFVGLNINKYFLLLLFLGCAALNGIGAILELEDGGRRSIIVGFNTIALLLSSYAVIRLDQRVYLIEKYFLLILLILHLLIHAYWFSLGFDISNTNEILFTRSVTPMYMLLILITIALLLLTLGQIRHQLELTRNKGLRIRAALTDAVRETNVANISKSIFLTNMSHELRTPLNIILGFSEALKMGVTGPLNDKQKNFVDNINFGGRRLLELINDLLSLSNIEAGNLEMTMEKIPIGDLVSESKNELEKIGKKYSCVIYFVDNFESDEKNNYISANRDRLSQILLALVDNAAKYGSRNGSIWLNSFILNEKYVRITIKDEGHGIGKEEFQNVFKPFNRAGIDSKAVEGTGAGLAIVKGLVEAMNGKINFESRKSYGSTFWIDLPYFTN